MMLSTMDRPFVVVNDESPQAQDARERGRLLCTYVTTSPDDIDHRIYDNEAVVHVSVGELGYVVYAVPGGLL